MEYKVNKVEIKPSKNGNYKFVSLEEANGKVIEVSIWSNKFTDYEKVNVGEMIKGKIIENGKYKNLIDELSPITPPKFYQKQEGIKAAQERKADMIERTIDRKEDSVKIAATARDATLIITTFYPELATAENKESLIKNKWLEWQKWLDEQWFSLMTGIK